MAWEAMGGAGVRWTILLLLILGTIGLPGGAVAKHEQSTCEPTSSEPDDWVAGHALFTSVDERLPVGVGFEALVYWESNGIPGIQRNDLVIDETCGHGNDSAVGATCATRLRAGGPPPIPFVDPPVSPEVPGYDHDCRSPLFLDGVIP